MAIDPPLERIIRSLSSTRIYISDLNLRLGPGEEVDILKTEAFSGDYYRTLSQLGNSQDLDQAVAAGWVEIEDQDGNILSTAQAARATYEATLWDVDQGGGGSGSSTFIGLTDTHPSIHQYLAGLKAGEKNKFLNGSMSTAEIIFQNLIFGISTGTLITRTRDENNHKKIFHAMHPDFLSHAAQLFSKKHHY